MNRVFIYLFLFTLASSAFGQSSVLHSGKWYKIAVEKNGVYKISYDELRKMGLDPESVSPHKIRIFGRPGGMLPQSNAVPRPYDLVELAIKVEGDADGKLDKGDYVLFYAEGPDLVSYDNNRNVFYHEENLFTNRNYYFVTISDAEGLRISSKSAGSGGEIINTFNDYVYHEENEFNVLRSGREWFGESFELNSEQVFTIDIPGIVADSEIKVVSDVMGQSYNPCSFRISYNDQLVGEQLIPVIPNSTYGAKGRVKRDTLIFAASAVSASAHENQRLKFSFLKAGSGRSAGYLNFFSIHVIRSLSLYGDQTIFRSGESINKDSRFQIANFSSDAKIWNITDAMRPHLQEADQAGDIGSFTVVPGSALSEFVVYTTPYNAELIGEVPNQDLHGMSTPDVIIVTHPDFLSEAERLAAHRSNNSGLSVAVAKTEQIYNEFASGKTDVTAIRNFIKLLYDRAPSRLKSVLLFGKGSYDYQDRLPTNSNFVPTYESRNSLSPLETFSSDDYFTFLENEEGNWGESGTLENHTLDIGIGRLPVKSLEEARIVVDKIISYDLAPERFGKWRKDVVFVADDGSNSDGFTSIHQSQANSLAEDIEDTHPEFNTRKIFLGTYPKKVSPNGEAIPQANEDILEEFGDALIINYTGHGSEQLWADEKVLTPEDIEKTENRTYPFLVTATCEFGRNDDPQEISSAELSILKERSGSIGLVTTARPVNSSTNFSLNIAFYNALFEKENEKSLSLGEIFRRTKNNSVSGVSNRNFSLLGDPSMTLALPLESIVLDEIKTDSGSDTLKALSKVIVKGRIINEANQTDTDFTGTLHATLFDKRTEFSTLGRNNPPFQYTQWFNPLFRGQAKINNGSFEFSFILPKNIAYEVNAGKLSLYALDVRKGKDASGSSGSFKIGESETNPLADDASPQIQAYMGDTTFIDGGTVSPNTSLVVRLSDESGLNISNYGIGNTMMAVLDNDEKVFLINDHFVADPDTYKKGWVNYPLYNVSPGKHTLTVKVWDTHNNPAQITVNFIVSEQNSFIIEEFGNYPNPFSGQTTIFFTHNRAGEPLEASVTLLNSAGAELKTFNISLPASTHTVNLLEFDDYTHVGKKLSPGLYFARLRVRSLSDGAESAGVTKLILSN